MNIKPLISIFILFHAMSGIIALLSGAVVLFLPKGNQLHKKWGKAFYYSMLTTGFSAMLTAVLPNHQSLFLFAIGVFCLYLTLTGKRAFNYLNESLLVDKLVAWLVFFLSLAMFGFMIFIEKSANPVLSVFALAAIYFTTKDIILLRDKNISKNKLLKLHIGRMIGAYIGAVTAFLVVNQLFSGLYVWFLPTLFGTGYIIYQTRKLKNVNI